MPLYNVHVYREMKLRFDNIEAASALEATDKVLDLTDDSADAIEDCAGETFSALVDLVDDENYEHSHTIYYKTERTRKLAADLLDALTAILPLARAEAEGRDGFRGEDEVADEQADAAWKAVEQAEAVAGMSAEVRIAKLRGIAN